jgi:hypothetical protein
MANLAELVKRWRENALYLRSRAMQSINSNRHIATADTQDFCANELEAALADPVADVPLDMRMVDDLRDRARQLETRGYLSDPIGHEAHRLRAIAHGIEDAIQAAAKMVIWQGSDDGATWFDKSCMEDALSHAYHRLLHLVAAPSESAGVEGMLAAIQGAPATRWTEKRWDDLSDDEKKVHINALIAAMSATPEGR